MESKAAATERFQAGDLGAALALYTEAASQLSGRDAAACFGNMSLIHVKQGRAEQALEAADQAVAADSAWYKAHFRRGDALFAARRYREAAAAYEQAASTCDRPADTPRLRQLHDLSTEADKGGLFFRQLLCGRDIAVQPSAPLHGMVFPFAKQMQNFVYLIGDAATRQAMVVDGAWDVQGIFQFADNLKVKIIGSIVTHYHFDHAGGLPPAPYNSMGVALEGVKELLQVGPVYVSKYDVAAVCDNCKVTAKDLTPLEHEQHVAIGSVDVQVLHTPGHTPGSQCLYLPAHHMLLTGDTLFIGSHGRVDLPDCNREHMFESLQGKLAQLPPETRVFPGHAYGGCETTIEQEKKRGMLKPLTKDQWRSMM
eukprot:m.65309 g.65309  ORF g.65309 m.65309 type:complete len:368 (+) comp16483_c0_seq1:3-1106(+)